MQSFQKICNTASNATQSIDKHQFRNGDRALKATMSKNSQQHTEGIDRNLPNILVWNATNPVPQLINIDSVCAMLSLKKSAVYDLVARQLLDPPCKLSPGRRGASRWLLSSVVKFIQQLEAQREFPAANRNDSSTGETS